ncbi:MAG TPA: ABC transporter permease [Herpetosiphonaceae bacterium]|nr:ABC transporter permease [Herpetosiphonaceae bacterium]
MRFGQHLSMTLLALAIALLIALPLGILITRIKRLERPVMAVLGILYTIPSLALLVLLIPIVGLGLKNAVIVLVIYAQVILVRNIVVGLNGVEPAVVEAARGMGMNGWQRLLRVEMPLALPIILAGIRIATVTIIGIGAVAALINAGGIGRILFDGVSQNNEQKIIAGSIAAAFLAGLANALLRLAERHVTWVIYGDES